jgi:hypothetical protein
MFNPTEVVIDAFVSHLEATYRRTYGHLEPECPSVVAFIGRMALENIANSDAPYHDLQHTIMVAEVGQQILRGKYLSEGGVSPRDWLHFMLGLLCHDIGYVRGVCRGDRPGRYVVNARGETVALPAGATDASLTPYHVDRSKLFVRERFAHVSAVDTEAVESYIEHTRFPVPEDSDHAATDGYPGLLRAADLIGQLADPHYLRKVGALFMEFQETGIADKLGYRGPADLRAAYPAFYWKVVSRYIQEGLRFLRVTQDGKQWIANLHSHVFSEEHHVPALGPERLAPDSSGAP